MSNAKHTPGPWAKAERLNGLWWHIWSEHTAGNQRCLSGRQAIACVHGESKKGSESYAEMFEANATLIAAAPELLEACKSLLTLTQLMANEAYNDESIVEFEIFSEKTKSTRCLVLVFELAKARAAIAKATGRADSGQAAQGDRHE